MLNVLHDKACFLCARQPKKALTYAWFFSVLLVFIAFIIGCIMAETVEQKSLGFAGIWTVLMMIVLTVGGTIVMRRYQTPLAIGFFLGVLTIMANQCLILTAIFGADSEKNGNKASGAFATFCFFLGMVYAIFGLMLAIFRKDLVGENNNNGGAIDVTVKEPEGNGRGGRSSSDGN